MTFFLCLGAAIAVPGLASVPSATTHCGPEGGTVHAGFPGILKQAGAFLGPGSERPQNSVVPHNQVSVFGAFVLAGHGWALLFVAERPIQLVH